LLAVARPLRGLDEVHGWQRYRQERHDDRQQPQEHGALVEGSLRRLGTDYIDIYWAHVPDGLTTRSTRSCVASTICIGRARSSTAGLSNFPAWRNASATTLATARGWAPLIGVQDEYSLVERSIDRETIPMARAHGLGIAGWSPLGGGLLTGKYLPARPVGSRRGRICFTSKIAATRGRILDTLTEVAPRSTRTKASRDRVDDLEGRGADRRTRAPRPRSRTTSARRTSA